jgi:CHAD domain-containing protein
VTAAKAGRARDTTLRALVETALLADVDLLVRHEPVVLADEDPEGVHQARVGIRRTRAVLRTFRDLFETEWSAPLDGELRRLAHLLGAVRDADVLGVRLQRAIDGLPAGDRIAGGALVDRLAAQRAADLAALLVELRDPRHAEFLVDLVDAVGAPRYTGETGEDGETGDTGTGGHDGPAAVDAAALLDQPARRVAARFAAKPWRKLRKEARRLHAGEATDDELHRLRIRAKRARYALEAVEPVLGKPARALAKRIAALQDVLGDHHDTVVAEDWLRAAAGDPTLPRAAAVAAGQLVAAERAERAELRAAWPAAWSRVHHSDTGWLRSAP